MPAIGPSAAARKALVAVIVPSYNYGSILTGCVESVLAQQGVDVKVLIVDDCSPDETAIVGSALADRDPRVEFRRHEVNRGLIATANEGLAWAADSDHVVLLSADDLLVPGSLQRAAAVFEANPRVGMVYGSAPYFGNDEPLPDASGRWRGTDVWRGADWMALRCRSAHNCISSPEVVVRTSTHREVGDYDPTCTHGSDLNMWLRIAAVSDIAYIRGAQQALYRVHATGMLRSAMTDPLVDLRERWKSFEAFFARCGDRVQGADALRELAGRALARQALWRASRAVDRGQASATDGDVVDELVAFALEVHPRAERLREWHGLALRRRLGAGRSAWFPPFLATGVAHRLRGQVALARWARTGV
jgi:glycosyltransferase involved in cell wall biosynthesis